jgi:hypothetical protein
MVNVTKVLMAILVHDEELESYARRIRAHEQQLEEYEAGFDDVDEPENRLLKFVAIHDSFQREHERVTTRHVNVLTEIRKLLKGVLDLK